MFSPAIAAFRLSYLRYLARVTFQLVAATSARIVDNRVRSDTKLEIKPFTRPLPPIAPVRFGNLVAKITARPSLCILDLSPMKIIEMGLGVSDSAMRDASSSFDFGGSCSYWVSGA